MLSNLLKEWKSLSIITHQIEAQISIQNVLNNLIGEKQKGIAVAVNETIAHKAQWESYVLQPNDKVLVIKATQGV